MAITNAMIVQNAQFELLETGKIGTTGRMLTCIDEDGNEFQTPEPEPIHTYQKWKQLGYHVKQGETAICKLTIWKHVTREVENTVTKQVDEEQKMFMKTACFFALHQVEKNAPAKPVDPSEFVGKKMSIEIGGKKRKRA